ncbi:hypothetical protein [Flavobacterium mesophilum]|uniref:hypothetical protein n=1 Tax=Flavobacterium mesophilum TaxID=3143495 RepID=UPI0031D97212
MDNKIKFFIIFFILLFSLNKNVLIYRPLLNFVTTKTAQGKIINKKEFLRRGYITGAFTYYYEFNVNDKKYVNPSYNRKYEVGDSVKVEYCEMFPFMNRIAGDKK